jgi:hypothetical protein
MDSPDEIVAKRIVGRLLQERLLLSKDEAKTLKQLTAGTLSGDDWKQLVDRAVREAKKP